MNSAIKTVTLAPYHPAPGHSLVYSVQDLATGQQLYVGSTSKNLTLRAQAHIYSIKAGTKPFSRKLANYYRPYYTQTIDIPAETKGVHLQVGNLLFSAISVPNNQRWEVEQEVIQSMKPICNKIRNNISTLKAVQ